MLWYKHIFSPKLASQGLLLTGMAWWPGGLVYACKLKLMMVSWCLANVSIFLESGKDVAMIVVCVAEVYT